MNVLDHLIGVQAQIISCRRLADENPDRAMALRFYQLADNLEQRVREVDRALCFLPNSTTSSMPLTWMPLTRKGSRPKSDVRIQPVAPNVLAGSKTDFLGMSAYWRIGSWSLEMKCLLLKAKQKVTRGAFCGSKSPRQANLAPRLTLSRRLPCACNAYMPPGQSRALRAVRNSRHSLENGVIVSC